MTRLYTEQEIRNAWQAVMTTSGECPSSDFQRWFFQMLPMTKEKAKPLLFSKDELVAVAATDHEKLIVHGIFAVYGASMLNGPALMRKAKEAAMGGNMEVMIRLAQARKEEDFTGGEVVRDANGKEWKRRINGGTHPWAEFGSQALSTEDAPKRPLKRI